MSRESNDAFDAYAAREGYKPGTWNYIRAAKAWQAALDYAAHGLNTTPVVDQKAANLSDNAPGVTEDHRCPHCRIAYGYHLAGCSALADGVPPSFRCLSTTADGRACRSWCGDAKCASGVEGPEHG